MLRLPPSVAVPNMAFYWNVIVFLLLAGMWKTVHGVPVLTTNIPGEYGQDLSLNCADASFIGNQSYFWFKNGVQFFSQTGEIGGATGRYSKEEASGVFKVIINSGIVSDQAIYKCSLNFANSNEVNLTIESKAVCPEGWLTEPQLIFELKNVYPLVAVTVTRNIQNVAGSTVSKSNGDRYDITWTSSDQVSADSVSDDYSITLDGYTQYTLTNFTYEETCRRNECVILCAIGIAVIVISGICLVVVLVSCRNLGGFGECCQLLSTTFRRIDIIVIAVAATAGLMGIIFGSLGLAFFSNDNCSRSSGCGVCCICVIRSCGSCTSLSITCLILGVVELGLIPVACLFKIQGKPD